MQNHTDTVQNRNGAQCSPAAFAFMLNYVVPNLQPADKICCNGDCNQGRTCPVRNAQPH